MSEDIKGKADKIVSDTLDSYMQHDRKVELDEDKTRSYGRRTEIVDDDGLPEFGLRKSELPKARSVTIHEMDRDTFKELAQLVRSGGREAEMSSMVLIRYADLLMRELENAMECGRLIWKSEKDAFEVKLMLEKVVKERVLFQTRHGELLPIKVV